LYKLHGHPSQPFTAQPEKHADLRTVRLCAFACALGAHRAVVAAGFGSSPQLSREEHERDGT
jgi:hypothetical protein